MVLNGSAVEQSPTNESNKSSPESDAASAGIRYRVEYCDKKTGDIIRAIDVKDFDEGHESGSQPSTVETVFVLLRKYDIASTTNTDGENDLKKLSVVRTYATPSYHIRIVSMAVVSLDLLFIRRSSVRKWRYPRDWCQTIDRIFIPTIHNIR
jgi:hypothetical protein